MSLSLFDFEPFCERETNAEIVAQNKFGIYELIDGSFVKKEITEGEFLNYKFTDMTDYVASQDLVDDYISGRPFVESKI